MGLAREFGVSEHTVHRWCMREDFPGGRKGPWHRADVEAYLRTTKSAVLAKGQRGQAAKGSGSSPGKPAQSNEYIQHAAKVADKKFDLLNEQARKLQIENDTKSGRMVNRDDVEQWAARAIIISRDALLRLPEMLATVMPPDHRDFVRAEADRYVRDVLKLIRRQFEKYDGDSDATT